MRAMSVLGERKFLKSRSFRNSFSISPHALLNNQVSVVKVVRASSEGSPWVYAQTVSYDIHRVVSQSFYRHLKEIMSNGILSPRLAQRIALSSLWKVQSSPQVTNSESAFSLDDSASVSVSSPSLSHIPSVFIKKLAPSSPSLLSPLSGFGIRVMFNLQGQFGGVTSCLLYGVPAGVPAAGSSLKV